MLSAVVAAGLAVAASTASPAGFPTSVPIRVVEGPPDSALAFWTTVATVLAAAFAFVALVVSWYYNAMMFRTTRRSLEDARTDQQRAWQPHVAFDHRGIDEMAAPRTVGFTNIGKGPALECRYVARIAAAPAEPRYFRAPLFAVGAESELKSPRHVVELDPQTDPEAIAFATRAASDLEAAKVEVVLCSDVFGKRWRFVRGHAFPNGPKPAEEVRSPSHWWQTWKAGTRGAWVMRAQRAEDEERERTQRQALRGKSYDVVDALFERYDELSVVLGLLAEGKGASPPELSALQSNRILKFGDWADHVALQIDRGDLDRDVLADAGVTGRLRAFFDDAKNDPRMSAIAATWKALEHLT